MLNEENIELILSSSPYTEIQKKRIRKELQQIIAVFKDPSVKLALLAYQNGLILKIEVLNSFFKGKGVNFTKASIFFHIILDFKYPFSLPRLLCITKFCEPSLADGRDYIPFLLKKTWNPSILLIDILRKIPDFLNTILVHLELDDKFALQGFGTYYLGDLYDLNDLINSPGISVFPAIEQLDMENKVFRYIAVSEAYFLTFEPKSKENQQSMVVLVSWAPLTSLIKLNRRKSVNNSSTIILSWHDYKKKEGLLQIISLNEEGKFVEILLKNMKRYQLSIHKTIFKRPDLSLEDISVNAFKNLDKQEILNTIEELEKKAKLKLDPETMDSSMRLYQKAIEYFSALNDPLYDAYLKKLQDFLQRENVQEFLKHRDDPNYSITPGIKVRNNEQWFEEETE